MCQTLARTGSELDLNWIFCCDKVLLSKNSSRKWCAAAEESLAHVETDTLVPLVDSLSGEIWGSKYSEVIQKDGSKHTEEFTVACTYPLGK